MGLACSNIRLLTLTARKADCEYGISIDSMRKMALTREQSALSQEYYSKLQAKTISYYNNGQYNKINYNYLMGYGANYTAITAGTKPLKSENSMILTDYKGQVVMSEAYANAITAVLGSSAMDSQGRGGTFSTEKIPEILAELIPGYSAEQFKAVMDGDGIETSYEANGVQTITGEETGTSTTVNNSETSTNILQSIIDFYEPIFKAAAANGWTTEYNNEMKTHDDYVSDAIVSGSFQLATVNEDGKMQAIATLQNMIINLGKEYYANVLTIANGTTLSTKVEKSTQGMGGETLEVEVPEKISFELPQLDENNSTVLSITVDFMNYFMGQGKDYPTNVTLTLDLDNAKELQKEYVLEDGTYDVPVNVLKENSDDQSMAAQAVESAQITVQNNEVVVTLKLKEMTIYGQTASVDKMEYQLKDGTYKEATVIEEEDGHPKKVQFKLDENKELTNVKFYYGGSSRGAIARLQLKLDGLTKVDPTPETPKDDEDKKDEENTSRFTKDGTYSVDVALWNATSDKESMAASAINSKAKIIVKDGKATMYLSTKEMSFGSIKASLQEFYIGSEQEDYKNHGATIIEKDAQGNPTLWAFELPHENEYINVMMNPHVAMMGNIDLAARLKIDYTTLTYVSDKTELELNTKKDDQQENTNKDQTANKENQINENQSVKTGDQTSIQLFMTLFIISITMIGFISRKKHEA